MNTRSIRSLLVIAFLSGPVVAQHTPPGAAKITVPGRGLSVPMGDFGGRPLVDVKINGKGPYRFILDLGADTTVVGDDLKSDLQLPSAGVEAERGPDGAAMGDMVKIDTLGVGEASLQGAVVMSAPLSRMFRMVDPPRGVLSASAFPGYLLTLDYPGKRVLIRTGELPPPDSRSSFGYTAEQILPSAMVRAAGTEVRVHVDSGSPGGLTLPTKYMKELKLTSEPTQIGTARTPHGEHPMWSATMDGAIELGQYKLDVPNVVFSDVNPIPGQVVGNIGYQVLKRFQVTLDAKNRRIRFEE
jgi:Aspartyl protease